MTALKALVATLVASSVLGGPGGGPAPTGAGRAALPPLPFDHILRYDELTKLLEAWAAARPDIVRLESLGLTPGGRKMWFLTLTNRATGPASDKPALVVDGNMHATEWGGGVAALHVVWRLLRDDGTDEKVTRLLDTRAIYVLPRMTPDGVEATLARSASSRGEARNARQPPGGATRRARRTGRSPTGSSPRLRARRCP